MVASRAGDAQCIAASVCIAAALVVVVIAFRDLPVPAAVALGVLAFILGVFALVWGLELCHPGTWDACAAPRADLAHRDALREPRVVDDAEA